jgi:crotonobetainyl-CoA:carnitine CoA-transferase CaiB-like acyl-CoA transferase
MLTIDEAKIDDWHRLCMAIGKPELANDPRFKDKQNRVENNEALIEILNNIFITRNREEWDTVLREAGVIWYCRINELDDLVNDPQVIANHYIWDIDHTKYGRIKLPGHPVTFTKTPATLRSFAPEVGQHTEIILTELLGYGRDEITKLREEGII